jgi:hypothetical protein
MWWLHGSVIWATDAAWSRVRIRLPPQSTERGQETWLCITKQISEREASLPEEKNLKKLCCEYRIGVIFWVGSAMSAPMFRILKRTFFWNNLLQFLSLKKTSVHLKFWPVYKLLKGIVSRDSVVCFWCHSIALKFLHKGTLFIWFLISFFFLSTFSIFASLLS